MLWVMKSAPALCNPLTAPLHLLAVPSSSPQSSAASHCPSIPTPAPLSHSPLYPHTIPSISTLSPLSPCYPLYPTRSHLPHTSPPSPNYPSIPTLTSLSHLLHCLLCLTLSPSSPCYPPIPTLSHQYLTLDTRIFYHTSTVHSTPCPTLSFHPQCPCIPMLSPPSQRCPSIRPSIHPFPCCPTELPPIRGYRSAPPHKHCSPQSLHVLLFPHHHPHLCAVPSSLRRPTELPHHRRTPAAAPPALHPRAVSSLPPLRPRPSTAPRGMM